MNVIMKVLAATAAAGWLSAACAAPLLVYPVRSADPMDEDFSDLAVLDATVADAQIVMLGEQSHGDGTTFLAKTRVLKYLHERHGFDVLAFESGIYDLYEAQKRVEAGARPSEIVNQAIFPLWATSDQLKPLRSYLDARAAGGNPIVLAGFDLQISNQLGAGLPQALAALGGDLGDGGALKRLGGWLGAVIQAGPSAMADATVAGLEADAALARQRLAESDLSDAEYWRQIVESTARLLIFLHRLPEATAEVFNMRDAQMAANLEWLATTACPGRKIVVWAATSHIVKDRTVLDTKSSPGMVPMGALLARRMGPKVRVLAFTAGGGTSSSLREQKLYKWGGAPEGSIEQMIGKTGYDFAFVSARDLRASLPGKQVSWLLGFSSITGLWAEAVDGIFYIRDMQPATYPARMP